MRLGVTLYLRETRINGLALPFVNMFFCNVFGNAVARLDFAAELCAGSRAHDDLVLDRGTPHTPRAMFSAVLRSLVNQVL